jgi:integrase
MTTVKSFADQWLTSSTGLEPTSVVAYRSLLKHARRLNSTQLDQVRPRDIQAVLDQVAARRSRETVRGVRKALRAVFQAAFFEGLIPSNPVDPTRVRGGSPCEEVSWVTREQAADIEAAIYPHYRLLVRFLFATGARWGEAIGLGPEHVEPRDGHAVVHLGRRVVIEPNGTPVARSYGKTSGAARDIVIPLDLGRELLAAPVNGYCFTTSRGNLIRRCTFYRVWRPACVAAGIPDLRVHAARHSHASWLANGGKMTLMQVRDRLGHSSLAITSRYLHAEEDVDMILQALVS